MQKPARQQGRNTASILQKVPKPRNRPVFMVVPEFQKDIGRHKFQTRTGSETRQPLQLGNFLPKLLKPRNKPVNMGIRNTVFYSFLLLLFATTAFAQEEPKAVQVDGFSKATNDDLLARVDKLWSQLTDGSSGVVILRSSTLANYLNKRRIEGCNLMRRYPVDGLTFVFENESKKYEVEFWKVPKNVSPGSQFLPTQLDYKLPELRRPLELTTSMAVDEFCPRHFDIQWYARFLNSNPTFSGKAVLDTKSSKIFFRKVAQFKRELQRQGVDSGRVNFIRRHFNGETDEQFWLIPPKQR
jgi:hypothetical protein